MRAPVSLQDVPAQLRSVRTPLEVSVWEQELEPHCDRTFANYLVSGLKSGFRIGFDYSAFNCVSARANMQSALKNAPVVEEKLAVELEKGRIVGPLSLDQFPQVHVSRFGVIPKNHQPGKWRLIVDLSHPKGSSVNDGISPALCSLHYSSVDEAVRRALALGEHTQLAKFDLESAYRVVPVHPTDRLLLGMRWKEELYVDTALPFGLRSAPKIFNAVADGLQWILGRNGVDNCLHYLDDFLIFGSGGSNDCGVALQRALQICAYLGVPIAQKKTEGPATKLVFLGIEIDTVEGVMRLPSEKLQRLQLEIQRWMERKSTTKRELLSLIGQLQHACCVVRPGRSFLRRMIALSTVPKELHHRVRLSKEFRSDLRWWGMFIAEWNGVGMLSSVVCANPCAVVTSDASGSWGCGAFSNSGEWFQVEWPTCWQALHITVKELLPIVMATALWGQRWCGKTVLFRCDNAAVVAIVRSGSCKDSVASRLYTTIH